MTFRIRLDHLAEGAFGIGHAAIMLLIAAARFVAGHRCWAWLNPAVSTVFEGDELGARERYNAACRLGSLDSIRSGGEVTMDFVVEQNIAHFRRLLEAEADPEKRAIIERLLRREEAKAVPANPIPAHPS